MAQVVYPYNPFNDNDNCIVTESFVLTTEDRNVYFPRACPFFFNKIELYSNATINDDGTITGTILTAGQHYALANPFDKFIKDYNQNMFSSLTIPDANEGNYVMRYSTLGGPYVLDEAAYAELVANKLNHDREASWEDFIDVPTEWPPEPHEHPINLVYNVFDMMVALKMLLMIKSKDPNSSSSLLNEHLKADLTTAHKADKSMVGLDNVDNYPTGTVEDLDGNNNNSFVTVGLLLEALRMLANGTLKL